MTVSHERLLSLLSYDPASGMFTWLVNRRGHVLAGMRAGTVRGDGRYISIIVDYKSYLAHRLAWFYVNQRWPREIDHINRNGLDNRLSNLREVTRTENQRNRGIPSNNTSGVKGVSKLKGKWRACLGTKYLGWYDTVEGARDAIAREKDRLAP